MPATQFVGYESGAAEGKILAIVAEDELQGAVSEGTDALIVLDKTTMYAEMGGQVGDHGYIEGPDGKFVVTDVQKNKGGKFLHYGRVVSGEMKTGDVCTVRIDEERRKGVCRAHTATHLLQSALEEVLGDHVHQAGSLVEPDRLRFDFTHFEAVKPEELTKISRLMSEYILDGYPVVTEEPDRARPGSAVRRRSSVRSTATLCAWSPWATRTEPFPWSFAAVRIWTTPRRSARSGSWASPRSIRRAPY